MSSEEQSERMARLSQADAAFASACLSLAQHSAVSAETLQSMHFCLEVPPPPFAIKMVTLSLSLTAVRLFQDPTRLVAHERSCLIQGVNMALRVSRDSLDLIAILSVSPLSCLEYRSQLVSIGLFSDGSMNDLSQVQEGLLVTCNQVLGRTHDALARAYAPRGDMENAMLHAQKALDIVRSNYGDGHLVVAHQRRRLELLAAGL